jgi:DNA (cytosine-5)-methyltransferase 1
MLQQTEFSVLRQQTGLSLQDFAERSGYQLRTVYRWENGEYTPKPPVIELLKNLSQKESEPAVSGDFTFIDLFAGIGGIRRGFEAAGGKCVYTSEWDLGCQKTYRANFGDDHPLAGDITQIDAADIPPHDVLVGGFPCQPFSIAGVSKKNSLGSPHGFLCGTQGTLFFDVARIIAFHQPKAFLLENVKNLLSHDKGKTFEVIKNTLRDELGYHISPRVINAKGFLPQNRERIFIVGFKDFNNFNLGNLEVPMPENGPLLSSILHPEDGSEEAEAPYTEGAKGKVSKKYTLSDKLWTYLQNYAEKHRLQGNGFGFGLCTPNDVARTLSARYYKDGSEILIAQKGTRPRRLTPRECARLMGFDRPGAEKFVIPVSDTQAYKQFGNSVAVPVVTAVANYMKPYIIEAKNSQIELSAAQSR